MIWFEVEDLLRYFETLSHPTGIQRVTLELLSAAVRRYPDCIGFCRLSWRTGRLEQIGLDIIYAATIHSSKWYGQLFRWLENTAGGRIHDTLSRASSERSFNPALRQGDVLICLGSPMRDRHYARSVAGAKQRYGLKYALLIHDILPIIQPASFEARLAVEFDAFFRSMMGVTDLLFTSSRYMLNELQALAASKDWRLPPVQPIRFGDGFSTQTNASPADISVLPERFVLFAATLEVRKNHRLLVDVWRRLVQTYGADDIPTLLFVGRRGWFVDDLMTELAASNFLDGKIVHLEGVMDRTLGEAYRRCLFTVYPSLSEGWGLPVGESLAAGKLCIASNRTSLPEAGGGFADYFDPADAGDCYAAVERALREPGYIDAREQQIAAHYRPARWDDCIDSIIAAAKAL